MTGFAGFGWGVTGLVGEGAEGEFGDVCEVTGGML